MKNYRAKIRISAKSERMSASIRDALAPDLVRLPKTGGEGGGRTKIFLKNSDIVLDIATPDIPSLRASINSYVRLVDASSRCLHMTASGNNKSWPPAGL
ncbi:MAG: hypothetical protein HRF40_07870 [Nitrososphaera sp.]